jgi:hypothetical protein
MTTAPRAHRIIRHATYAIQGMREACRGTAGAENGRVQRGTGHGRINITKGVAAFGVVTRDKRLAATTLAARDGAFRSTLLHSHIISITAVLGVVGAVGVRGGQLGQGRRGGCGPCRVRRQAGAIVHGRAGRPGALGLARRRVQRRTRRARGHLNGRRGAGGRGGRMRGRGHPV